MENRATSGPNSQEKLVRNASSVEYPSFPVQSLTCIHISFILLTTLYFHLERSILNIVIFDYVYITSCNAVHSSPCRGQPGSDLQSHSYIIAVLVELRNPVDMHDLWA